MTTSGERITKVTTETGATGFIPESVPVGAVQGLLERISASEAINLEEVRRLYGDETYEKVKANPSEAAAILRSLQLRDQSA
ncbi:hypothetical protein [Paraburkholderia youngii]|uniref:hypothetical protein n=1 Tax=Paraburkholderia youngii TaxID=2782701 RepID=UPI003D1B42E4